MNLRMITPQALIIGVVQRGIKVYIDRLRLRPVDMQVFIPAVSLVLTRAVCQEFAGQTRQSVARPGHAVYSATIRAFGLITNFLDRDKYPRVGIPQRSTRHRAMQRQVSSGDDNFSLCI